MPGIRGEVPIIDTVDTHSIGGIDEKVSIVRISMVGLKNGPPGGIRGGWVEEIQDQAVLVHTGPAAICGDIWKHLDTIGLWVGWKLHYVSRSATYVRNPKGSRRSKLSTGSSIAKED